MLFLDATNEPAPVREVVYNLTLSGVSPVTVQTGGVQGEHRATRLKFQLSAELTGWEGTMLDKGRLFVRADACDGSGVVHRGVPLELTDNVSVLYYDLEQQETRCGGFVKVQLVFSVLDEDNCTMEQVKSYYATLELESAPNYKDEDWRDMNGLFQQAKVYAETAETAAAEAQAAAEEAEAAVEEAEAAASAAETAEQGAQSAQTIAESHAQSAKMANLQTQEASQIAINAVATVEQTANEAAASALKALQAEDNAADWANAAKETVESLPVEKGEGPNSLVQKRPEGTFGNEATGDSSAAFGNGTRSKGQGAAAFGVSSAADSMASFAGGFGAVATGVASSAFGFSNKASGMASSVFGRDTEASGEAAHAEGVQVKAQGTAAHTEGLGTQAVGDYTHAEGMSSLYFELLKDAGKQEDITEEQIKTLAQRIVHIFNYGNFTDDAGQPVTFSVEDLWRVWKRQDASSSTNPLLYAFDQLFPNGDPVRLLLALGNWVHAEGCNNLNAAEAAHIEGILNIIAKGRYGAHAEGGYNLLDNAYGHAEGFENKLADGRASHIEGQQNEGAGDYNHIEGYKNKQVSGDKSDIGGELNTSSGSRNVVRGKQNNVTGDDNIVMGTTNTVEADGVMVAGETNTVSHDGVRALGDHLTSYADGQTLLGQWNEEVSGAELIYGCGTSDGAGRKNLFYGKNGALHAGSPLLGESDTRYMTVGYNAAIHFTKPETLRMAYAPTAVAVTAENDIFKRMIAADGSEVKGENNETRLLRLAVGDVRYVQLDALKPRQTGAYYAFYDAGETLLGAVETYTEMVSGGTLYLAVPAGAAYLKLNHDVTEDFAITAYGDPAYVGEMNEAVEAAQAEAEAKADALELGSSTGKAVAVTDSAEGRIVGLSVYGESTQDGTPTPEAPVEIESVENPVVGVYGKNLFNKNAAVIIEQSYIDANGEIHSSVNLCRTNMYIPVRPNTTYTVTGCGGPQNNTGAYLWDANKNFICRIVGLNQNEAVFTTTEQCYYVDFQLLSGVQGGKYDLNTLQLEVGSTATAYEPYKQPQTVTIPYTLRGIKGSDGSWAARDEIVVDGKQKKVQLIRAVGKAVYNETESFTVVTGDFWYTAGVTTAFDHTIPTDALPDAFGMPCMCNLLQYGKASAINKAVPYISGNVEKIIFAFLNTTASSVEELKTFLTDNPMELVYALAEPEVTDITDTEAGQALLALVTHYPNTTVVCDADCALRYKADTTIAYNNLLSRVAALEAAAVGQI